MCDPGERETDLEKTIDSEAILRAHEQRHHCEALYARGRISDAAECLGEVMNTASEAVRTNKLIASWLPDFTRRCATTLETTGDEASDVKRYDEAIAAYSAVVSLDHPTPNIVLDKWASTVLIRGSSNGALTAAVKFKLPGFAIFRAICDVLEGDGRVMEAITCFRQMGNELVGDFDGRQVLWQNDFLRRCAEGLEKLGDTAMDSQHYDEAADHFATLLSLDSMCRNHSPTSPALIKWAKSMIACGSTNEVLAAATKLKLANFRAICDALEGAGHAFGAIVYFRRMKNEPACDTISHDEGIQWEFDFLQRCAKQLERLGDTAQESQNYREAADYFSTTLTLSPKNYLEILIKRSNAQGLVGSWEEALKDADEAIKLDPSCHRGYEMRHAALHGMKRYAEAVETFDAMLLKIEESPDVDIRKMRGRYVDARFLIRRVVQQIIRPIPRVLVDTTTGCLCNKQQQADAFEALPEYSELISSMTTQLDYARIWETVTECYRFVMFSHEWEDDEPTYQDVEDISIYDLKASQANAKLRRFCLLVRSLGFQWAWSDNSCVDKSNHVVLQEFLVTTFAWYRGSSLTIVYLRDVSSESLWNTRAWPYQGCIAAQTIRFYTKDWKCLGLTVSNHKESPDTIPEIQKVVGVPRQEMVLLSPGLNLVHKKLHLASRCRTMPTEDTAYSLLGVFDVAIPVKHGEGDRAVGRLLEHVLTGSGDATILAWTGRPGSYNSCLPVDFTVYGSLIPPHVPLAIEDTEMEQTVIGLRATLVDLSLATKLHSQLTELPSPTLNASRLRLPCIVFPLTEVIHTSQSQTLHVYRATTPALGEVKIETMDDLTGMEDLCLVHPWIRALLDQESSHGTNALENVMRALRCVARLRQPFGALLFAPVSCVEYKRVATDSLIMVQIREDVPLTELIDGTRRIEVL